MNIKSDSGMTDKAEKIVEKFRSQEWITDGRFRGALMQYHIEMALKDATKQGRSEVMKEADKLSTRLKNVSCHSRYCGDYSDVNSPCLCGFEETNKVLSTWTKYREGLNERV